MRAIRKRVCSPAPSQARSRICRRGSPQHRDVLTMPPSYRAEEPWTDFQRRRRQRDTTVPSCTTHQVESLLLPSCAASVELRATVRP